MGVADYGNPSFTTTEFVSWANFTALSIGKALRGATVVATKQMTIQQNLVDYGVFAHGHTGEYWAQDVPYITQTRRGYVVNLLDNIWNFSSPTAGIDRTQMYVNLLGNCGSTGGGTTFYYCEGSLQVTTTLPFEIKMTTVTGTLSSGAYSGDSYIEFAIGVYHSGALVSSQAFDEVAFDSGGANAPVFTVGGNNPLGLYNDAETVLCGPGGGSKVAITSIGARISESYLSGVNLVSIPHAFSDGYDTAETATGVHMTHSGFVGLAASGADNAVQLW